METDEILSEVARIAEKVVSSEDSEAPLILLELKQIYQQCPQKSLRMLKINVWHYGLVHILIELLGQNFSSVNGQWATAVQLGSILSHTLSGLQPEKLKKTANLDASQIEEYYDGVLPTALHSLLVLTNNILCLRDSPKVFPRLLENISKLCQSHHTLLSPLLQSPYLLHMLSSSNDGVTLHALLSFIKKMFTVSDSVVIPTLSLDVIHNYTDELIQRITNSSELILALDVFSVFLKFPDIADSVAVRYHGLTQFLSSLQLDSATVDIRWMIEILGGSVDQSENLQDNLNHAAIVIQSHWRGYNARKKVKAIHQGVVAFQRLFRKRKAKSQREESQHNLTTNKDMKQESQHVALRMFHEKQFKIIEQLPAKDVDKFLKHLQELSAVKIQKWWRDHNQTKINKMHTKPKKKSTGQTKQQANTHHKESVLLQIDQATRDRLQAEIAHHQSHHPVIHKSRTSLQQLHTEVQKQLQIMYLDRTLEKQRSRKRKLLLNQLEVDSTLLLGAPSLEKARPNNIAQFTVSATGITHMARLAHEEELKSLELPWWKRTNLDSEEIDFKN